jgi:tRNA-splicing ligase RtcB (3'-phosphate/5'-hydroxy nucleic acid ligase)
MCAALQLFPPRAKGGAVSRLLSAAEGGDEVKLACGITVHADDVESSALDQLKRMAGCGVFDPETIQIMPDVHAGAGSVIGFTVPLGDKVIPNVIGVDIGCGVSAMRIEVDMAPYLSDFDTCVRNTIPSGFSVRQTPIAMPAALHASVEAIGRKLGLDMGRVIRSVGTLGGGNHFIEIDRSRETGTCWLLIHSGSRNFGLQIALWHQKKAKANHPEAGELAWLEGADAAEYMADMRVAQEYAAYNRASMIAALYPGLSADIDTVHNFIADDDIIRKGAIQAMPGQRVIIPWNMRDGAIIGTGKGNPDWNFSAPHGAGRTMGRGDAKRNLSMDDYAAAMAGIYSTCVNASTLDEAPMAYKASAAIEAALANTVEVTEHLIPIYNFKAAEK